ncbi:hypothetical protein [Arthrobacter sp. N1]|uniref:hypothetical protein n=1 Tax=Arthrobacter sp. N1 TaxID=619291 RepID=UPI003BAE9BD6
MTGPVANIVIPDAEWGVASTITKPGSSITITGSGYEPGQRINIGLGVAQTDVFVIECEAVYADEVGNYSHTITLAGDLEPGTYAVVTNTPDEAPMATTKYYESRRWATVEVIAP